MSVTDKMVEDLIKRARAQAATSGSHRFIVRTESGFAWGMHVVQNAGFLDAFDKGERPEFHEITGEEWLEMGKDLFSDCAPH